MLITFLFESNLNIHELRMAQVMDKKFNPGRWLEKTDTENTDLNSIFFCGYSLEE